MSTFKTRRNTPIKTLLDFYNDKKSGRVCVARNEIKYRFDYLDWSVQKRILKAFLADCKTDREWAYDKLLKFWDDSFIPVVKSLWNQYQEYKCSWVIIRYFPEEYVFENLKSLSADGNYYFICRRLGHRNDFMIDRTKMSIPSYLSILYSAGKDIDDSEALDMLYEIIGHHCSVGHDLIDIRFARYFDRGAGFNPLNIKDISRALYYLGKMQKSEVVASFIEWCDNVEKKIKKSQEYQELVTQPLSDIDYVKRLYDIAIVYMYLALPLTIMSKIKNPKKKNK